MNFLAHQYLSFDIPPVMVGNFIADTIRGSQLEKYPEKVQYGIRIHRSIDTFTDSHPLVLQTRSLLYPWFGKYAAVVQDVFYDHFLAINWKEYSEQSLTTFVKDVYRTLESNKTWMNERALRTLYYMHSQNWLGNYRFPEGIDRALSGLSYRAKFDSKMDDSLPALEENFDAMNAHFRAFFPELIAVIREEYFPEKHNGHNPDPKP